MQLCRVLLMDQRWKQEETNIKSQITAKEQEDLFKLIPFYCFYCLFPIQLIFNLSNIY